MIRPCDERDLDEMYAIINEAARAYEGVIPADRYHQPYMPMAELRREAARMTFFGWEEDADARSGQLTGVIGYEPVKDVTLVRHCYVLSDRQRQGVGSALVRHVMARTRTHRLLVGTWAAADWAIRFYEKHGFRLLPDGDALLRTYWHIPARQRETSVVLGRAVGGGAPPHLRSPLSMSKSERRPPICHSERSEESGDGMPRCYVWDAPPQTLRFAQGDSTGTSSSLMVRHPPEADPPQAGAHHERRES